jgi:hypothetical protein
MPLTLTNLTSDNPTLTAIISLLTVSVAANLLFYFLLVVPRLYIVAKATFPTGFLPWRYFDYLKMFRQVLAAQGRSTNGYYMLLLLTWFNLLLAAGIGIYLLSQTGNDPFQRF